MPIVRPGTLRDNELNEFPIRGPFGGVQSEIPLDAIERLGFDDCLNIILRKAMASVRPSYTALPTMVGSEPINGVADFFDVNGNRIQVVITPTKMYKWDGVGDTWVQITGTLTGPTDRLFGWAVVANKLLFGNGVDKVQLWDGITAGFGNASANAVPARYMMELNKHLVVGHTIEAGNTAHQRVRWTGAGDPTDWISFNAGQNDLFNDLGPITGMAKIYQAGFIWQQWGITQTIPTGIGLRPFDFVPLGAHSKGNIAPYSLAAYGEEAAFYVGKDNIYLFDGTRSVPVGDRPIQGIPGRVGARKRILAELLQTNLNTVFGFVTTSINGNDFNAYWLAIPTASVWVYNIDEGNWTRFQFNKTIRAAGRFSEVGVIRIMDLAGTIAQQTWTPNTLQNTNPLDGLLLGFSDGVPGTFDFGTNSEQPWFIKSGFLVTGDRRHRKTVTRFRIIALDLQSVQFTLTLRNEIGENRSQTISFGANTGVPVMKVIDVPLINGMFLRYELSGSAGSQASFIEFAPLYDVAGEQPSG